MIDLKNKKIMFIANGGKEWIGGLYYVKNIIYTMIKKSMITGETSVYILVKGESASIFETFRKYKNVNIIEYKNNKFNDIIIKASIKFTKKIFDVQMITLIKNYKIDYIYPVNSFPLFFLKKQSVYWIPDFQHIHLPEMFSEKEIDFRNKSFRNIAQNHLNLILSSNDAYNDYKTIYPQYLNGVNVINFESFIEDDIENIDNEFIKRTLEKYNVPEEFVFLPNQFWKHKNHITAFKAISYLVNNKKKDITLVCTGNTEDYRNIDYFSKLKKFINEKNISNNIRILGFISRREQLALMIACKVVLQPSLFEGWGTVVEDAKALNKSIIMSNINVHYEQKNDKCTIFERDNYVELGNLIEKYF